MAHPIPVASIDSRATIADASRLMHDAKADELIVTEQVDGRAMPRGVLRPRDIVVRVLGVGLDPSVITVGDIVWGKG